MGSFKNYVTPGGGGCSQSVTDCDKGEGVSHCVCHALVFESELFILESFAIAEATVVARTCIHTVSLSHIC